MKKLKMDKVRTAFSVHPPSSYLIPSNDSPPSQVDIFYMDAPDDSVPPSVTLAGVNEAYKKGYFTRFSLFGYRVEDIEAVYNHCNENGHDLPTVY